MFCDLLSTFANGMDDLGILDIPLVGNALIALIEALASLLNCG